MSEIQPKPRYHTLKISVAVAAGIAIIILGLHLWFVYNAKSVLKSYITEQSGGKIKLELSQLDLNLLTRHLQVHQATLVSTDSISEPITYKVTFSKLSLNVGSVLGLLFKKQLLLDSLKLYNPSIQVLQWRKDTTQGGAKDELSIPQEMGKVYNSMIDALNEFGVRRIVIDNARFSLVNKVRPGAVPVNVSNIFFNLARTPVKEGKKNVYLKNEHTIELRSTDQNITLPGGRHQLSFKSFNLHLFRQSIELDSCTVTAIATDSVRSSYKIFFKKLLLTGVDFNALSTKNLIQADSVYCEAPYFNFDLYRSDAVAKKTELPDPSKIMRELAGNMNLAFVGVKDAGIQMDIHGKSKRSFYNSNKDNFEIRGLRINPDSSAPVSIARFDMVLRDYLLYNEDSSSVYSFDSLQFMNDQIVLNNFGITSGPSAMKLRNLMEIKVPHFSLTQLDWYQLIFEQNLVAKEAVMHNPVIDYTRRRQKATGKKIDLFTTLLNIDSMVALENIAVINGQVNMQLGPATSFNVQDIDFNIQSNRLLRSTNNEGLRSAIQNLSFSKGILRIKDITAQLSNARFTGNNLIYADRIVMSSKRNQVQATINDVYIDNMLLDDAAESVEVDGLGWKNAKVILNILPSGGSKAKNNGENFFLRNVSGNNTNIAIVNRSTSIATFVNTLAAASIIKNGNAPLRVEGFHIAGNDLSVKTGAVNIRAASYDVSGDEASSLTGVEVLQMKGRDSMRIASPKINFSANLNDIIGNDLHFTNVEATSPFIRLNKWDTAKATTNTAPPTIRIDKLTANEPDLLIRMARNDSVAVLKLPFSPNSLVQATGIEMSDGGMKLGSLKMNTTSATFAKNSGEVLGVEEGKIAMDLSDIQFSSLEGKLKWSGVINELSLQNANGLQMGKTKNNLFFQNASLGNLSLSSDLLPDFSQLLKKNVSAWLRIPQGQFIDSNTTLQWYNASYNNTTRSLSLDSFIYHPTQTLDTVLAKAPYQLDYITMKTGGVTIDGLDVARYEMDSSFIAQSITVAAPVLTVYRDKAPPINPNRKDKLLPVDMIKNMNLPVAVEEISIKDGLIVYGERNGKSRKEGTFFLTNLDGKVSNIKNSNFTADDSLRLQLSADLLNAAGLSLTLAQSYQDTLSGFLLQAQIAGTDLAILNPVLAPLSNVKIASGTLDSLSFRAVGRQDVALGEMQMFYKKLRIRLIKGGDPEISTFLQDVASVLANAFVIKRNNNNRMGVMYFKHLPKQSFVNYIIKTTVSGIASSVGAIRNKKYTKQYEKVLKENNTPAIKL
jgi:hypothetical protein